MTITLSHSLTHSLRSSHSHSDIFGLACCWGASHYDINNSDRHIKSNLNNSQIFLLLAWLAFCLCNEWWVYWCLVHRRRPECPESRVHRYRSENVKESSLYLAFGRTERTAKQHHDFDCFNSINLWSFWFSIKIHNLQLKREAITAQQLHESQFRFNCTFVSFPNARNQKAIKMF